MDASQEAKRAAMSIGGFACNQGFIYAMLYLGSSRSLQFGEFAFQRAELFGILLCMLMGFILVASCSTALRDTLLSRSRLWLYATLLVVGSMVSQTFGGFAHLSLLFECIMVGFPAGLMLCAWGRALALSPVERSVPEVFIGSALAAAVCLALTVLPIEGAYRLLFLAPLGSVSFLREVMRTGESSKGAKALPTEDVPEADASASRFTFPYADRIEQLSSRILLGTFVFGLATGSMEMYVSDSGAHQVPTFAMTALLFVLFCIAATQLFDEKKAAAVPGGSQLGAVGERDSGPLDTLYRLAVLLMMAGFLCVPILGDFKIPGESIVLAGYLGLSVVLVSLFLIMNRLTSFDAAVVFAQGFGALFGGEVVGVLLGNILNGLPFYDALAYTHVAFAGIAVLLAYLFLFTDYDMRALTIVVAESDAFDAACAHISQTFGLSNRESEILPFALRGRTSERIAQELFISKNTVDTHMRRIYSKCGIKSRQELIDLGERTERSLRSS